MIKFLCNDCNWSVHSSNLFHPEKCEKCFGRNFSSEEEERDLPDDIKEFVEDNLW